MRRSLLVNLVQGVGLGTVAVGIGGYDWRPAAMFTGLALATLGYLHDQGDGGDK